MADYPLLKSHGLDVVASWGDQTSPLERFVTLQAPENRPELDIDVLASAPPILSFARRRDVELPWSEILGEVADPSRLSVQPIRDMLESSWGIGADDMTVQQLSKLLGGDEAMIRTAGEVTIDDNPMSEFVVANGGEPGVPSVGAIPSAQVVFRHGSGRWYRPLADEPLTLDDFSDPDRYSGIWRDKLLGVEQIYERLRGTPEVTIFEEVDLRAIAIERAMYELLERRAVAEQVAEQMQDLAATVTRGMAQALLEGEKTSTMHDRLISAKLGVIEVERQIDRIVAHAASLGYTVFKKDATFEHAPGDDKSVKAGDVYRTYERTAHWSTTHEHTVTYTTRVLLVFSQTRTRKVTQVRQHSRVVPDYRKVDTSTDPLVVALDDLHSRDLEGHVFARRAGGFVSAEGVSLESVMQRCEFDEEFRLRTAVLLPVYEERLTGRRELIKYSVFVRPLPGLLAIDLPGVSLVEELAYSTSWQGTELGELVSGINLAPGETREVTMSRDYRRETSTSRSTTSIFEVNTTESNELSTEMENQFSEESDDSSYVDTAASVKASYGVVSGEASAKAGASSSLKQTSQAISRVARKSAQSINRQNREEVTTSTSARTMVSTSHRTTATMQNINEGRTLNLMFYRVYNRYDSGLFLEDLKIEVVSGREVIAGSGVLSASLVPLTDLGRLVSSLDTDQLPYQLGEAATYNYRRRIVEEITATIEREYADTPKDEGRRGATTDDASSSASVELASFPSFASSGNDASDARIEQLERELAAAKKAKNEAQAAKLAYESALARAETRLRAFGIRTATPLDQQQLRISSGSLYLDAALGVVAATEPFSEAMRVQEVRFRAAEALRLESQAQQIADAIGAEAAE